LPTRKYKIILFRTHASVTKNYNILFVVRALALVYFPIASQRED
jgi:hypothetical protein